MRGGGRGWEWGWCLWYFLSIFDWLTSPLVSSVGPSSQVLVSFYDFTWVVMGDGKEKSINDKNSPRPIFRSSSFIESRRSWNTPVLLLTSSSYDSSSLKLLVLGCFFSVVVSSLELYDVTKGEFHWLYFLCNFPYPSTIHRLFDSSFICDPPISNSF